MREKNLSSKYTSHFSKARKAYRGYLRLLRSLRILCVVKMSKNLLQGIFRAAHFNLIKILVVSFNFNKTKSKNLHPVNEYA